MNAEHLHIWLHEFGHGFGFPDYYNWDAWAPGVASPNSVMVAGRASPEGLRALEAWSFDALHKFGWLNGMGRRLRDAISMLAA
ncbi:hypothetical protein HC776_01910, partial [bacterium]|nr:hypothetical protein [bacterium]